MPPHTQVWGRPQARRARSDRAPASWGITTNAVKDILAGNIGALAAKVEAVLASTIPIVLDFLATLLGIGSKIQGVIKDALAAIRAPVTAAIDAILLGIKNVVVGLIDKLVGGKDKGAAADKAPEDKTEAEKKKEAEQPPPEPGTPMTEEQIIGAVAAKLGAPTKATDPAEALAEKKAQADILKQQFQPSAPVGKMLKITFKDAISEDVAKDREVDMGVGFSPDTPVIAPLPDGGIVGIPLGPTNVNSLGTTASADPVVAGTKGTRTKGAPPPPFSLARKELSEKNLRDREARRKKALAEGRPFTPSPETAARVYVQGHLISEALGGKAIATNLQTINISLNKRMSDVENEVVGLLSTPAIKDRKELRDESGKIINKAFRYMVTTSPGPAKREGDLSLVPSTPANDDLHAQEENLISSVTITAEEIVNIKGRGIEEGDKKIGPTPLEHVLDPTFIP